MGTLVAFPQTERDEWDDGPACERCGGDMDWEPCSACGGCGDYDAYEEDPSWYRRGDREPCGQCAGTAGNWFCRNTREWCESHPKSKVQP